MTDLTPTEINETLARFEWPDAKEITVKKRHIVIWPIGGTKVLDDYGNLRRDENCKERHPLYTESLDACARVELQLFGMCKEYSFQNDYEGRLAEMSNAACTGDVGCTDDSIDCGPWWHRTCTCYPASVRARALAEVIRERGL